MDPRMAANQEILAKENAAVEARYGGKSKIYKMLPGEDGSVYDNRIIIKLWRPAIVCPEIFGKFYPPDLWDFKAAVKGHWVTDEEEGVNAFVYCPVNTARYYAKWFGKAFDPGVCPICGGSDKAQVRYIFQVFDYQKLIGERPLDEGEDRPYIQILSGPETIYKQLFSKLKMGYEFWDSKVVRITKDTKKGKRWAEYNVEMELNEPVELRDEGVANYLKDEANLINPVPDAIKLVQPEGTSLAVDTAQRPVPAPRGRVAQSAPAGREAQPAGVVSSPSTLGTQPAGTAAPAVTAPAPEVTTGGKKLRW